MTYIDYIRHQDSTVTDITQELIEYDNMNMTTKAKYGENLIVDQVVYKKTINLMGDVIYEKIVENKALRETLGEVDEEKLEKKIAKSRLNCSKEKNNLIFEEMRQQITKLKQMNKSLCPGSK